MTLAVEQPGPLSLVQDLGRPGLGHLGVSTAGAFDRRAMRQANALLGNDDAAPVVEVLAGGLVVVAEADHLVAVTGAVGPLTIDGAPAPHGRVVPLATGRRLTLGPVAAGLRSYVGVSGGLAVTTELGSASTDTLAHLGPPPLAAGDRLATGARRPAPWLDDVPASNRTGELTLDVVLGPRDDWFTTSAVRRLLEEAWRVSPASDRVGVRLTGPLLERARTDELPSEPCLRGSIQVAADGQPIIFGPDHPVTGGYPVIAVVTDAHTDQLAQARPGHVVRLRRVPLR